MLEKGAFSGTVLVRAAPFPKKDDLVANLPWLKGIVAALPDQAPSAYLVADALLYLHVEKCKRCLINVAAPSRSAEEQAVKEAITLSKLVGHARLLWRNSESSTDHNLLEIKQMFVKSPKGSSESLGPDAAVTDSEAGAELDLADAGDEAELQESDAVVGTAGLLGSSAHVAPEPAAAAWLNAMKSPPPAAPPGMAEVMSGLILTPPKPVDSMAQNKQVRLQRLAETSSSKKKKKAAAKKKANKEKSAKKATFKRPGKTKKAAKKLKVSHGDADQGELGVWRERDEYQAVETDTPPDAFMGDGFKGAIGKVPQVEVVDLLDSDAEEEGALAPEEAEEEEEEEEVLPEEAEDEQDALAPEEAEVGEGALALEEALAATLEETLKPDGKLPIPADMPTEALPQSVVRGKKNYTIYAGVVGNDARVEVQLANKSFWLRYVRVLNDDESRTPPYRNLSWSKIGSVDKAWEQAKQAVHWDEAVAAQAAAEETRLSATSGRPTAWWTARLWTQRSRPSQLM
ncbi:unnamed protein product [Prorocentrum cordatum]|uniref:Tudor domain-containing protein n=1 Tax=Prorocentrum cordatum TaxID=2364126 RepID=A0ABN9SHC7_9DINO|nr:unnamed protein product [Polarella glacialis]